jgi:hypothetical protein
VGRKVRRCVSLRARGTRDYGRPVSLNRTRRSTRGDAGRGQTRGTRLDPAYESVWMRVRLLGQYQCA